VSGCDASGCEAPLSLGEVNGAMPFVGVRDDEGDGGAGESAAGGRGETESTGFGLFQGAISARSTLARLSWFACFPLGVEWAVGMKGDVGVVDVELRLELGTIMDAGLGGEGSTESTDDPGGFEDVRVCLLDYRRTVGVKNGLFTRGHALYAW
jgi:hypothetical protein